MANATQTPTRTSATGNGSFGRIFGGIFIGVLALTVLFLVIDLATGALSF